MICGRLNYDCKDVNILFQIQGSPGWLLDGLGFLEQLLLRLQVDGGVIISDYYTYCTLHIDTFS